MIGTQAQQRAFKDRLQRIAAGGENTNRHVFVGPVEEAVGGKKARTKAGKRVRVPRAPLQRSLLGEFFVVPISLAAGAAAVLAGRVGEFHFVTEDLVTQAGAAGPYMQHAGLVAAVLLLFIASRLFRLRFGARGKATVVGFLGMLMFENIAVAHYPDVFAQLYSPAYVAEVVAKIAT